MPTTLDRVATAVAFAAVVGLGLAAGAMLTEAVVIVGFWRAIPADEFLRWFGAHAPRLVAFYAPLEIVPAVLALAAAALFGSRRRAGAGWLALATVLALAVLATFFVYFQAANASFVGRTIALTAVPDELLRWERWQWGRTGLGVGAFVAALLGYRQGHAAGSDGPIRSTKLSQ